ncbi:MAG: lipoprotein signal peptidase [Symploca sp. SIO3C6]|nr:lipoprotein signal peptidase [Symploca sp. SIO3C6]
MPTSIKNQLFWLAAFIAIVFDQITKYWVVQSLALGDSLAIWDGVFHFTYVVNTGAAFSLFSENGGWLRWLSLIVSLGLMLLAIIGPKMTRLEQIGFGCILGGALGNGLDRFASSAVVDFLDFRLINFPIFNLADVFINIGIACLFLAAMRQPPEQS